MSGAQGFSRRGWPGPALALLAWSGLAPGCALVPWLWGEATKPCPPPASASIRLVSKAPVNMNDEGDSLSTEVRVFLLASQSRLKVAVLDELVEAPEEVLKDELLGQERAVVYPDAELADPLVVPLKPEGRYLALVAVFRRAGGNTWRALFELPSTNEAYCDAGETVHLKYELSNYQISGGQVDPPPAE